MNLAEAKLHTPVQSRISRENSSGGNSREISTTVCLFFQPIRLIIRSLPLSTQYSSTNHNTDLSLPSSVRGWIKRSNQTDESTIHFSIHPQSRCFAYRPGARHQNLAVFAEGQGEEGKSPGERHWRKAGLGTGIARYWLRCGITRILGRADCSNTQNK